MPLTVTTLASTSVIVSRSGLRFRELTELCRKDIDLAHSVIRVRRAVTWPGGQAHVGTPTSHCRHP